MEEGITERLRKAAEGKLVHTSCKELKVEYLKPVSSHRGTPKMHGLWFANETAWIEHFPPGEGTLVYEVVFKNPKEVLTTIDQGPEPNKLLIVCPQDIEKFEAKYTRLSEFDLQPLPTLEERKAEYDQLLKRFGPKNRVVQDFWKPQPDVSRQYRELEKEKLARDYGGVYFPDFSFDLGQKLGSWYHTLDVSSGALWNVSLVEDLKLLGEIMYTKRGLLDLRKVK